MNFRIHCDNKGCRKEMEPVVDKDTLQAYCTVCNEEVKCINIFMRRQMAATGMVRKNIKQKMPWSVKCKAKACEKEAPPVIKDKKVFCFYCGDEMTHLTKPFVEILKQNLKKQ